MLYGAGEAASVWASAPRDSWELPAFALQKPTAVRPCGLQRLRDVAALRFPGCIQELRRPPDEKRPPTLAASKPPTRRGVYIRAASSTRLKPPLNSRCRGTASRASAAENNTCANPPSLRTNKPSTRRRDTSNLKISAKTTPKNK